MTPHRRLLIAFLLPVVVLTAASALQLFPDVPAALSSGLQTASLVWNGVVFLAALFDLASSPRLSRVEVERETAEAMSVGARNPVRVWLTNRNRRPLTIEFHDEPPLPSATDGLPFATLLSPQRLRGCVYHVVPHHRGPNQFGDVYLRSRSRLGFWIFHDQRPLPRAVRIYPDIQAVHGIELLARRNRAAETGYKLSRLRGRGNEFDRLREYRREDEYRHIDWKATARQRQLISREYVVERNQNILLLLDCGRSMHNQLDGISHLDRALNAAIVLSYIALRQGDNVGFLACSNQVERWVRPMRGAGAIQSLIRHVYDLEPRYAATDYGLMVEELRRRHRKRSLVVLLTHALDELHLADISRNLPALRSPHLVLAAFLKNVPLNDRAHAVPTTDLDAFQVAAAAEMIDVQSRQIAELQHRGLLVLNTLPGQLSADLISQYLEVKARHLL